MTMPIMEPEMTKAPIPPTEKTFTDLPLELRRKVYQFMSGWPLQDHLSVLLVSHNIYNESKESFDLRPLKYPSQSAFVQKVANFSPMVLHSSESLYIHIRDLALSYVAEHSKQQITYTLTRNAQHNYAGELRTVCMALAQFLNLEKLTIAGPAHQSRAPLVLPPPNYLRQIFACIATSCPQLQALRVKIHVDMNMLLDFTNLRSLSITGFSPTEGHHLAPIFGQLRSLETLEIACFEEPATTSQGAANPIQPSVITAVRPLKTLVLRESYTDAITTHYGIMFSPGMCDAIQQKHSATLEHLTIYNNFNDCSSHVRLLSPVITHATRLETLSLSLKTIDVRVLGKLPMSLQTIDIDLGTKVLGAETLYLKTMHSRMPLLERMHYRVGLDFPQNALRLSYETSNFGAVEEVFEDGKPSKSGGA
jgi:hypothetical protein